MSSSTTECRGWWSGWTLAAPAGLLVRESACPLDVSLADRPGSLLLRAPRISLQVNFNLPRVASCEVVASGFRIQDASTDKTGLISCFKPENNLLLVEADENTMMLEWPGATKSNDDGSEVTCSEGNHHVVMVGDKRTLPNRHVFVSGVGDVTVLLARGRTSLTASAHEKIDGDLLPYRSARHGEAPDQRASPREYLKSRLRPPSDRIPYPWLAGPDDQPVWDLSLLFPVFRALVGLEPEVAVGFIRNALELMDAEGRLPGQGGHDDAVVAADASWPLLVHMVFFYYQQTGRWPWEPQQFIRPLSDYLHAQLRGLAAIDESQAEHYLRINLLTHELRYWGELRQFANRSLDVYFDQVREATKQLPALSPPGQHESWAWTRLVDKRASESLAAEPRQRLWRELCSLLEESENDAPDLAWSSALLIADESVVGGGLPPSSQADLNHIADRLWRKSSSLQHEDGSKDSFDRILFAGLAVCLSGSAPAEAGGDVTVAPAFLWKLNRVRWLIYAGLVAVIGLFLASVVIFNMFRSTLPRSVFETQSGLMLQHYKAGDYDIALQKLQELQRRGNQKNSSLMFVEGKIHFRTGNYPEAIRAFSWVMAEAPDEPAAQFNLGLCYFRMSQYALARETFAHVAAQFEKTYPALSARSRRAVEVIGEMGYK